MADYESMDKSELIRRYTRAVDMIVQSTTRRRLKRHRQKFHRLDKVLTAISR